MWRTVFLLPELHGFFEGDSSYVDDPCCYIEAYGVSRCASSYFYIDELKKDHCNPEGYHRSSIEKDVDTDHDR